MSAHGDVIGAGRTPAPVILQHLGAPLRAGRGRHRPRRPAEPGAVTVGLIVAAAAAIYVYFMIKYVGVAS